MIAACLWLSGCFGWSPATPPAGDAGAGSPSAGDGNEVSTPAAAVDLFSAEATETTAEQQPWVDAARPFIETMVRGDYPAALALLPPAARARMSRNQFVPEEDEQQSAKYEAEAITDPTAEQFAEFMTLVENRCGAPTTLEFVTVETDPEILSRREPLSSLFLGNMPETVPVEHRKAAIEGRVVCTLSDVALDAMIERGEISAEDKELIKENQQEGEGPYFKVRTVVIDAGSGPEIGYFEIGHRSIWD